MWNLEDNLMQSRQFLFYCCSFQFDFLLLPKIKVLWKPQRFIFLKDIICFKILPSFHPVYCMPISCTQLLCTGFFQLHAYFPYCFLGDSLVASPLCPSLKVIWAWMLKLALLLSPLFASTKHLHNLQVLVMF